MNPAAVLALADQAGVSFSISAAGTLKAKGGREQVACLAPLIKEHKDALLAHLKAMEQGTETSLGTISSPSMAAEAKPSAPETASVSVSSVLPLQPLQGVPPSDQEREAIAAGLTPAMARRAAEARIDWIEWALGFERMTQEEAERVASFRKMDAALISARSMKKPYLDSLGIPRFPSDCEPEYRHWADGQPLLDTLLELRAQDWAIDSRVTREHTPDAWRRWQEIKAERRK
ncbi:hypothetical protein [Candidatus Electronema sp. JC]|uniref:hypothetical protein n=1 Tax=Candidatus Electronema sp. JC TaxID=3401570 RepID=UPI003B438C8C